jgi:hypothetical protein
MRRRPSILLLVLLLSALGAGEQALQHETIVRVNPPLRMHVVRVDLTDSAVKLRVVPAGDKPPAEGPWPTTLHTVRHVAQREGFDVAVNGDFFATRDTREMFGRKVPYFIGNPARVLGWAMSDGQLWSRPPLGRASAALAMHADGKVSIGSFQKLPDDAHQAVSGSGLLVDRGRNVARGDDRAPRTAVGLNADSSELMILVVDGRRENFSAGLTLSQLADEMIGLGCATALNLDGGGSSTLVLRDRASGELRTINRPSDGHDARIPLSLERAVANVVGIVILSNPGDARSPHNAPHNNTRPDGRPLSPDN